MRDAIDLFQNTTVIPQLKKFYEDFSIVPLSINFFYGHCLVFNEILATFKKLIGATLQIFKDGETNWWF